MNPYEAVFQKGALVRIAERSALEQFSVTWTDHHPLEADQLAFAGQVRRVKDVGYYHGGDPLYALEGVPGVWHEECLKSTTPLDS